MVSTTALPVPPTSYGGIEKVIHDLSAELAARGNRVSIAATAESTPPPGVELIRTVSSGRLHDEERAYEIYKEKLREYDIVCDHSLFKVASKYMTWDGPPFYVPVCHILDVPKFSSRTPRLVCVSSSHASYIHQKYGYSSRYVHNGIRPDDYPVKMDKPDRSRFLFIGRLSPEKGALQAIRISRLMGIPLEIIEGRGREGRRLTAARWLARSGLPIDYVAKWLYRGPYGVDYILRAVREIRNGGCSYWSNVSHERKVELLSSARALLFPLQYEEPFGLAVVEAMICGTPVVAYSRGAMPELIKDGVTGFLVKPDDIEGFADALRKVDRIDSRNCRNRVISNFTAAAMARNYENLFKEVIDGAKW